MRTPRQYIVLLCSLLLVGGYLADAAGAANTGASVVVIYNSRLPESKKVADYYAEKRQVPPAQILGFDLPTDESISRQDFIDKLQDPLYRQFDSNHWFTFGPIPKEAPAGLRNSRKVVDASVRYAVLCFGVPTRILRDPLLNEESANSFAIALRRNEASVDSQLATLPALEQKPAWVGPLQNPIYAVTNAASIKPSANVLVVTRLDGPSAAIAKSLVDKAMDAETNGLWGRAYFDTRGITNGEYGLGDEWIRSAANLTRALGFETEIDTNAATFPAGYPMSQIAFYAGWYDESVSGPFTLPEVEFMPGAFAYHLHSFNAQTIRSANARWVGPLLAKGATCTMGSVDEPFLQLTPDLAVFFHRFMVMGFSFGEAAYASQASLSWQNIAIGDPLYRPFAKNPKALHQELEERKSWLLPWSVVRWVNLNLAQPDPDLDQWISYLENIPLTRTSAVMKEKLADLYLAKKKISDALDSYELVLKLNPTPQQKLR
ncbi:MAG TPA: TIGR03790 family protein, partial [Verrucomicrobiae bacterium]